MSLATTFRANIIANLAAALDHGTAQFPARLSKAFELANGTGLDQADLMFSDQRTLGPSTSEDLDLAGSLTDAFGNTISFARIKLLALFAAVANGDNLHVGAASLNQWATLFGAGTDLLVLRPGGAIIAFAPDATGYTVTAGTGDLLAIDNQDAGGSATYDIILVGASA